MRAPGLSGEGWAAGSARFELPAAALPFDVTVPTMVLAPRAAAWTAKERAEGCGPEAGREPEREPARGAGRDHAGARGSRGKRRPESARPIRALRQRRREKRRGPPNRKGAGLPVSHFLSGSRVLLRTRGPSPCAFPVVRLSPGFFCCLAFALQGVINP